MLEFLVPDLVPIMELKHFLRKNIGISLTNLRKIKQSGKILINGSYALPHHLIKPGDIIKIDIAEHCEIVPCPLPLKIAYEDDYLLVIDKPAGMLVHPTTSERLNTLGNALMYYYQSKQLAYGFHPVHRLDRNTSGLVLIAKLPYIQHLLSKDEIKNITREYLAIVVGTLKNEHGTIDAPIARHPASIIERVIHPAGQYAVTDYEVVKKLTNATVVKLILKTGRTHQIRVHMAHLGHPLLGDDLYGGSKKFINRQALHAARLYFTHPISDTIIDISSNLPSDMTNILQTLDI